MPNIRTPSVLLTVVFLIWFLFPDGDLQGVPLATDIASEQLSKHRVSLDTLNASRWGDFAPRPDTNGTYLNLTGFRQEDGLAWGELENFREKSMRLSRHAMPPLHGEQLWDTAEGEFTWINASGVLRGDWIRHKTALSRSYQDYNLTKIAPAFEWTGDQSGWARNMTTDSGKVILRIEGNKKLVEYDQLPVSSAPLSGGTIRSVKGTVSLEEAGSWGHSWDMRLHGVHWPRQGVMLMATTSEKFDGIFGLPHLSPGPDYFQSSQRLLNETLAAEIDKKEQNIYVDQDAPWSSDIENPIYTNHPSPHCEYIMYAQVHPPTKEDLGLGLLNIESEPMQDIIRAIEAELDAPMGAPVARIPRMQVSAILYSPDCGFYIETKGPPDFPIGDFDHLQGMKSETHVQHIQRWLLAYAAVMLAQAYLLKNQITESYTPSNMGRVSFITASVMSVVDSLTFSSAATWVSTAKSTLLPTLALVIAAFLSMTLGANFMSRIFEVQLPEQTNRRGRDGLVSTNSAADTTPASSRSETPPNPGPNPSRPATHQTSREPVIVPLDQDIDAPPDAPLLPIATTPPQQTASPTPSPGQAFHNVVGRYFFFGLCIAFIAVSSSTWYASLRGLYLNLCVFFYMSLWVPQIHRNVMRNCRRALGWQFVVGQTVLRMLPIAYFWCYPDNFIFAQVDVPAFGILCCWVWLQLFVLAVQDVVGPRFGIPRSWVPDAYDYHRVLREDNIEEGGGGGGLPIGLVAADETNLVHIDCTICREVLEVPVVRHGQGDEGVGIFARKVYMVTPCRHIFHTKCLENWMRFRLQCPICREDLPPL